MNLCFGLSLRPLHYGLVSKKKLPTLLPTLDLAGLPSESAQARSARKAASTAPPDAVGAEEVQARPYIESTTRFQTFDTETDTTTLSTRTPPYPCCLSELAEATTPRCSYRATFTRMRTGVCRTISQANRPLSIHQLLGGFVFIFVFIHLLYGVLRPM